MVTDYPSSVSIQLERPQYNSAQATQVSVVDACHHDCLECSLIYISTQALDGFESFDHANAARYSSTMPVGYDGTPHLATVSVHLPIFMSPSFMVVLSKGPG